MILSCPNCGGALLYDPKRGLMKCNQCNGIIHPKDMAEGERKEGSTYNLETEYMKTNLYSCTSCGAGLMINDSEISTFCSFCGQPTIVFDRVSEELKPDCILPFSIDDKQAIELVKKKFRRRLLVPREIKKLTVDKIRGIYVPHWLFSIHFRRRANLIASGATGIDAKVYREAEADYDMIPICATKKVDVDLLHRIEPFGLTLLKPFQSEYLSGFYADRQEVLLEQAENAAVHKSSMYMNQTLMTSCQTGLGRIVEHIAEYYVKGIDYVLLPVWFLTLTYQGEAHTILVNGQTGKVAGSIPTSRWKLGTIGALLAIILSIGISKLFYWQITTDFNNLAVLIFILLTCGILFFGGLVNLRTYRKDKVKFKSKKLSAFSKERQDKTWVR